jgi:hypothetical protein
LRRGSPVGLLPEWDALFKRGFVGASRRILREIFGVDIAEFNKVERFFEAN